MVKKEVAVFVLVFFLGLANAEVVVNNLSLKENYFFGDVFSGKINLSLSNISSEANVSSNFGHRTSLIEFLDKNNADYKCSNKCERQLNSYSRTLSKKLEIDRISDGKTGIVLFGEDVVVENISFNLASDFQSSRSVPLIINFFDGFAWEFKEEGENFERSYTTGCYTNASEKVSLSNTRFCQKMTIPEAKSFSIGAKIVGSESRILNTSLFDDSFNLISRCVFNFPANDSCIVRAKEGENFEGREYFVCIETKENTGLSLLSGTESKCGWAASTTDFTQKTPTHNFLIFAKTPLYKSSEEFYFNSDELNLSEYANSFLDDKYEKNCKSGCILPIEFSGVKQNIYLSDLIIDYRSQGIRYSNNTFYELEFVPFVVNFSGVLELSKLDFKSNKDGFKKLTVRIDGEKIIDAYVNVSPDYVEVLSIYPSVVPAKIPSLIYVYVDSKSNITSYKWNFGGAVKETTSPFIYWTFNDIKNYSVNVSVKSESGLSDSKHFEVRAISPQNYISSFLGGKKTRAKDLASGISEFPLWLQERLKSKTNFNEINLTLKEIETGLNKSGLNESDYLKIAEKLQELNIPIVRRGDSLSSPLIFDLDEIFPKAVSDFSGERIEYENSKYKNSIWNWQNEKISGDFSYVEIIKTDENKERSLFGRHYKIKIKSKSDDESYLFLNKKSSEIFFRDSVGVKDAGEFSVVPVRAGSDNEFEFFVESKEELIFFASPRLSFLTIDKEIDETCNFNSVCEPERGEDWKNCRSDCKPRSRALFYAVISFFVFLIFYTLLQIWYKKHYEKYLFGDERSQIYNLLMFIANARTRGMRDSEIVGLLKKQGWNSEKIKYLMKKSYGKNVRMIEIVPISKVSAFLRNRKAKRENFGVANDN